MRIRCRLQSYRERDLRTGRMRLIVWPDYYDHNGDPQPWMKFKCRWCKKWICGVCEGTVDPEDPIGNELCDPCWAKREARKTARKTAPRKAA
jgi:hypothetical protein